MNIETYKKAYRAALAETRKEFSDERDAKDHASAIATVVASGDTTDLRDSGAARAAILAVGQDRTVTFADRLASENPDIPAEDIEAHVEDIFDEYPELGL